MSTLGLEFKPKDVTGRDTSASFKEKGWMKSKLEESLEEGYVECWVKFVKY